MKVSTAPYVYNPKVASDAVGNFVVVWARPEYHVPVIARRFDSTGTPLSPEFQVNTYTTNCCGYSIIDEDWDAIEVASGPTGNFMVVWRGWRGEDAVVGRAFDSSGAPAGDDFRISTGSTGYTTVGVTADGFGRFIVVWHGSGYIHGRRFDSTGTAVGSEFQVSTLPNYPFGPKASADAAGNFVVTWTGSDEDVVGVFAREFDSTGAPLGPEFQVNTTYWDYQRYPSVASAADGDFVVVWTSYYSYELGFQDDIFGQRFGDPEAFGCSAAPMGSCRQQTLPRKGRLVLRDKSTDAQDRFAWKWSRGEATDVEDFGDPFTTTDYALCVYDASTETQPVLQARAPAGGECPGRPCWKHLAARRREYLNKGLDPDGLLLMRLKAGVEGRVLLTAQGRGANVDMPQLPLEPPVRAQLQASNGECWESVYGAFIQKNRDDVFRAKPGSPRRAFLAVTSDLFD